MKRNILLAGVAVVVLAVGVFLLYQKTSTQQYTNDALGISFSYPSGYIIQEGEHGTATSTHYAIVLTRTKDAQIPENGEGPTDISVDIYGNPAHQTLQDWLGTSASNYALAPLPYATTTVAGISGVLYPWSGLYEGITAALPHGDTIVAVSVTYLDQTDTNLSAFQQVLTSLKLR
jgi:hypothetical protein